MRASALALLLLLVGRFALFAQVATLPSQGASADATPLQMASPPLQSASSRVTSPQLTTLQSASSRVTSQQLTTLQSASSPPAASQSPTGQGSSSSSASSPSGQQPASGQQSAQPAGPQPVPYSPDEFPGWMKDLRRGEVITVGAFPITLLFSSLTYQLVRYAQNHFAAAYAPAIFGATATPLTNREKIGVLLGGASLAVVVALIDFTLGKVGGSS